MDRDEFPKNKRSIVHQAETTFLDGDPVKGCQTLFEEIEAVTRSFAIRSKSEGWWRSPHTGEKAPNADLEKGAWAKVLSELNRFIDVKICRKKCPAMHEGLLAGARSLTDPRNLTSHKPKSLKEIIARDKKLRTWFENSRDMLREWYDATKPLRL